LVDIDVIDLESIGGGYGPSYGAFADAHGKNFTAFGDELFAVAQASDGAIRRKDDGRGENRAEQGATADFINTGDPLKTLGLGLAFVFGLASRHQINDGLSLNRERLTLFALAEAGGFTLQLTEIVEFGAPDAARAHDIDMIDDGGMQRENALYTLPKADFANGDGFAQAGVLAGDHGSFESLQAFFVAFLNLDVDTDGIAGTKRRSLGPIVFGDYFGKQRVRHGYNSLNLLL